MEKGSPLGVSSGPPRPSHSSNPFLRELMEEDVACSSTSSHKGSNERLREFASGSVMRDLAAYMRERRILGPSNDPPLAVASAVSAQLPTVSLGSSAGAVEHNSSNSTAHSHGVAPKRKTFLNPSRPRLFMSLQPEVGQEMEEACAVSGVCPPQDADGADSDGGEAVKSKTAAFGFLYDDSLDERDSAWVRRELRVAGGETDAVLSCPGCFLPICYQCQRCESSRGLFRAVAAFHVATRPLQQQQTLQHQQVLQPQEQHHQQPVQQQKQQRARDAGELPLVQHISRCLSTDIPPSDPQQQQDEEDTHAIYEVFCKGCGTVVGWQDADEVFHFTEVIPGEA